jgi:SAM-dependent methyltransferase
MKNKPFFSYKKKIYPNYIKKGNACSFIIPFAQNFCKGRGLDIGGYLDWTFPGATPINVTIDDDYDAYNLPKKKYDYIFSSHTLEHLPLYVKALEYWKSRLKKDGVLFLYLPHPDMEYWNPQNNRKHYHLFDPIRLVKVLSDLGYSNILSSERDLYWSFSIVAFNN